MIDETQSLIDGLLIQWHEWARKYQIVSGYGKSPMFQDAPSSRQWDSEHDVLDHDVGSHTVRAVEFAINGSDKGEGAMIEVYRIALRTQARNLSTGYSVWKSPRLPNDLESRAQVLGLARAELIIRLGKVGIG